MLDASNILTSNKTSEVVGECPGSLVRGSGRSQTETSSGIARGGGEQLGSSKLGIER